MQVRSRVRLESGGGEQRLAWDEFAMMIQFIQRLRGIYPNTGEVYDYSMTMQKTKQI